MRKVVLIMVPAVLFLLSTSLSASGQDTCCVGIRGNVNGDPDDHVNVADITYLVDYLFRGGPEPPCEGEANVDGSGGINVADLTYLVDYLFRGGPAPPACLIVGLLGSFETEGFGETTLLIFWAPADNGSVKGYNAYRSIAGGPFEKLNDSLITGTPVGPELDSLVVFFHLDSTVDTTSTDPYVYYVTAVTDTTESGASRKVIIVPATLPRDDILSNMQPTDTSHDVTVNPTFTWDPMEGASSYLISIKHCFWSESDLPNVWVYGHTADSFTFKDTVGHTYIDAGLTSLEENTEYEWSVSAFNDSNFSIAASDVYFRTTEPKFVKNLVDEPLSAGNYVVEWYQLDDQGQQVGPGFYKARMVTWDVEKKFEAAIEFEIVGGAPANGRVSKEADSLLPTQFWLDVDPRTYSVGQTVWVYNALPTASHVWIDIERATDCAPPEPPEGLFGTVFHDENDSLFFVLLWTESPSDYVEGYDVYRRIGSGSFEKINRPIVGYSPFGPGADPPLALAFADSEFDSTSADTHWYYVTAMDLDDGKESSPSDTVSLVPALIDWGDTLTGVSPDDAYVSDLNPTFSWDVKLGAASYVIWIQEDTGALSEGAVPFTWIYGDTGTEFVFKDSDGYIYVDEAGDMLAEGVWIHWFVSAIDSNNFAFVHSNSARFHTNAFTLVDGYFDVGCPTYCWGQTDNDSLPVGPGTYGAHMVAGSSDTVIDFDTTVLFQIFQDTTPVPNPCDTNLSGVIPTGYSLGLKSDTYVVGDSVLVIYCLPGSSYVFVEILREP